MSVFFQRLVFVAVFVTIRGAAIVEVDVPDFHRALKIVEDAASEPGNINYQTFCKNKSSGASKLGCRMKEMPDVGLLVCLESDICETSLTIELASLRTLVQAGLKVLPFYDHIISGLKCGKTGSVDVKCEGYLVEWVLADEGKLQSLRKYIREGNIGILLDSVKGYQTTPAARSVTADDLERILKFTDRGTGSYTRICDLQGFFMKAGGFAISDPEGVDPGTPLDYTCYDQQVYPTTEKTIDALKEMVRVLRPSADKD